MWRTPLKQPYYRKLNIYSSYVLFSSVTPSRASYVTGTVIPFESHNDLSERNSQFTFSQDSSFRRSNAVGRYIFGIARSPFGNFMNTAGYATVSEAVVSTSNDEDDIHKLVEGIDENARFVCSAIGTKVDGEMKPRNCEFLRKRQIKMETEAWQEVTKEYQELLVDMHQQKLVPNVPYIKSLFLSWFESFRDAITNEHNLYKKGKLRWDYGLFFDQLPSDMMAVITMHKLMELLMPGGNYYARLLQVAIHIGEAIEHEARIHTFLETSKKIHAFDRKSEREFYPLAGEQEKLRKQEVHRQRDYLKPWGPQVQLKVGSFLLQLLMETAYVQHPVDLMYDGAPDVRPAFLHTYKSTVARKGKYGVIECDPLVRKGMEETAKHMVIQYMPMLIPPVNWTEFARGAHLFLPSVVLRTRGSKQQRDAVKKAPKKQLELVYKALNALGNTKWKVNQRIMSVVERIWADGGGIANLVEYEDVPLPEQPSDENEEELKTWKSKLKALKKVNTERHSQRCDVELKLAVARKLKNEDGFYYPHNLDFRGRAYPIHPHLNHLGSDLCRGILEFAVGRPLGESGLRWLKIHLANVYGGGIDKLSYKARITFSENHIEDIFDSADHPLEGKRWWLGAEDPFQCLATCMNLSEALKNPCPETTISYLPIHQDGSCNGLQHYAALGRDRLGALAVNLVGGDKPADVYSVIASRVLDIMKMDAAKDPKTDSNVKYARLLIDQVDRKLVKQTVMTSVYGVTYSGAHDQIKRRLKERGVLEDDDKEFFSATSYTTKTILNALGETFEDARGIMYWLGDCAKIIAKENQPVRWMSPIGLPIVQHYCKIEKCFINTSLQRLTLTRETDKVMKKQQRTAFPPNFVHSLDGSHMMMTAIACSEAGLNFAGVHDSYWTHACDVDTMNNILREKFVELYESPILENLLKGFQKSFPKPNFPPLPKHGDLDLREVLKSTCFFN